MRRLRWLPPKGSLPPHPYRDSAILYGVLAVLVVVVAAASGGSVVYGVIWAVAVFVAATGYSWWRVRERLRSEAGERER
jgi:predicted tellurium resistance membrane protein TerC